jgi:RNA polymerase primary sigma factor
MKKNDSTLALYLKEINKIPMMNIEEERETALKAVQGDKAAQDKLVAANLRFVVSIAKKYQGRGMPLQDLISEGNIGLINALDKYDAEKGFRFISYAVWWIRQAIIKALGEKVRAIRLPLNRVQDITRINQARSILSPALGQDEEMKELGAMLNMKPDMVRELINLNRDILSLESPANEEQGNNLMGDYIEDSNTISPEDAAMNSLLKDEIEKMLATLDEKEAAVIRSRFGLDDGRILSLHELGDRMHVSKERVRQIERRAIQHLQTPAHKQRLYSYVA